MVQPNVNVYYVFYEQFTDQARVSTQLKQYLSQHLADGAPVLISANGRPHFSSGLDFNISHESGVIVAGTVGSGTVGVDLAEQAPPVDFTASELAQLFMPVPSKLQLALLWAAREAYLKSRPQFQLADLDRPVTVKWLKNYLHENTGELYGLNPSIEARDTLELDPVVLINDVPIYITTIRKLVLAVAIDPIPSGSIILHPQNVYLSD